MQSVPNVTLPDVYQMLGSTKLTNKYQTISDQYLKITDETILDRTILAFIKNVAGNHMCNLVRSYNNYKIHLLKLFIKQTTEYSLVTDSPT